jgi:hypothetical protein
VIAHVFNVRGGIQTRVFTGTDNRAGRARDAARTKTRTVRRRDVVARVRRPRVLLPRIFF